MSKSITEILSELEPIFCSVLVLDRVELTPEITMDDIPEWDSIANIELIAEIGKVFGVTFTTQEMSLWENVGDIAATLSAKIR